MSNHKKITSTERFTDKEDTMQNISTTDMEGFQGNIVSHPMTEDDLLSVLHEIPVTGQSEKDLQAALRFVSDYLCDQDNAKTNIIINTEVRSHFKLTPNQLKLLNTLYRQVSKAYQAGKHTKNAQSKTEIPAWYKKTAAVVYVSCPVFLPSICRRMKKYFLQGKNITNIITAFMSE